ncbi:hypothetical protein CXG81DRAFT_27881 [Caulochytrium protostelioides]|uniref:Nudix hydrolase domain-containing protein n=1 Tax=Caulochytrium protostelioides TaxID=1555241 RepID=A0A4P9WW60_9FUNG|nr:hypothetical protein CAUPRSCDRAFT_10693 [Caulochytrium protostelioides]RKO99357.1 hypothetical protein CXG81DRAFT_27881 [Caulochytrium protostelioides]|eukprot:RKO99357.1 hypothetical protein CXG81DRAFT_27881 [Caulochytrium protostelioides]
MSAIPVVLACAPHATDGAAVRGGDDAGAVLESVEQFAPFRRWRSRLAATFGADDRFVVHGITVTDVDQTPARGDGQPGRLLFCKATAHVTWKDSGHAVAGITFLRGPAAAVLVLVTASDTAATVDDDDAIRVLLVEQPRVPIAQTTMAELPAGMLDEAPGREDDRAQEAQLAGAAAKELEEECGIVLRASDLVDLTALAYGPDGRVPGEGVYPSAGGCDESIGLYAVHQTLSAAQLAELENRSFGLHEEGERIRVRAVPLKTLYRATRDMKALAALALFRELRADGRLPMLPGGSHQ